MCWSWFSVWLQLVLSLGLLADTSARECVLGLYLAPTSAKLGEQPAGFPSVVLPLGLSCRPVDTCTVRNTKLDIIQ